MTLLLDQSIIRDDDVIHVDGISKNAADISRKGGIVRIPKANYDHLEIDEFEHILMKFLEVQENTTEFPKPLRLKAKKTLSEIRLSGQIENYIFDDGETIYFDLFRGPNYAQSNYSLNRIKNPIMT